MSAAEKYGSSISSLPAGALAQAQSAGQSLERSGVSQQSTLGSGSPAQTPAMKYGSPSNSEVMGRSLSQSAPGRSL